MGQSKKGKKSSRQRKPILKSSESPKEEKVIGGPLSSNLIQTIYQEKLTKIANQQAEKYAEALLNEEDASSLNGTEGQNNALPNSYLFASKEAREELLTILSETSSHFSTVGKTVPKWKVHANAAKFERHLDEKYGRLRPFITQYPEIETYLRNVQRKFNKGEFSPFRQGKPPIDKKASIILLFIMHRNGARPETTFLTALFFLVGLQPWALILLVALGYYLFQRRKKKKISGWLGDNVKPVKPYYAEAIKSVPHDDKEKVAKLKNDILLQSVGESISPTDFQKTELEGSETYDTLLVGSGPSTLYAAALLARTGRTVLVLSPETDASGCQTLEIGKGKEKDLEKFANVPFDVYSNNVAHTSVQQRILAPALCTESDVQGGIRFAQIGTEADGFTSDILSIPGMGVDSYKDSLPFLIRAGGALSIAQDAATFLADGWPNDDGIGNSTSSAYLSLCTGINASAQDYYLTKLFPEKVNKMKKAASYQEASIRFASNFLDKGLPFNPHVRSLMAGIGMRGENISPSKASMAAQVTNICACLSPEGFSYPVGGPRALCHALASVIEQNGGRVVTGVKVKEFLFDNKDEEDEEDGKEESNTMAEDGSEAYRPRCHGVKLDDNRIVSVGMDEDSSVLSMLGFINTFIFKMPAEIRSKYGLPLGLPALSERRPLLKVLFCLNGSSDELNVTGADWYRLPNAGLPLDEKDPETGEVTPGHIGVYDEDSGNDNDVELATAEVDDTTSNGSRGKRTKVSNTPKKKIRRVEFVSGSSWMKVSFPSAKDPSWKERHNGITTCVVTVEAGTDFMREFDTLPKIYAPVKCGSSETERLLDRVTKDLIQNFPQLKSKISFCRFVGPTREGLTHNPQRFAAKGIRPKTPYPGLFMGGSDLTIGDSFSASMVGSWIASNAILGYSFVDHLFLEKNLTSDISQFMKSPSGSNEDNNIAVPFQMYSSAENCENNNDTTAESREEK